jgi:hypothetical protein
MYKLRYECGLDISGDGTVQTGPGSTPTVVNNVEIKYRGHYQAREYVKAIARIKDYGVTPKRPSPILSLSLSPLSLMHARTHTHIHNIHQKTSTIMLHHSLAR